MKLWIGLIAAVLCGCAVYSNRNEVESMQTKKKHLLVVTHTTGFRHSDSIEAGEPIIKQLGDKSDTFTVDYCRNADDVASKLSVEGLKAYDGVLFLNTTGDLGIPDLKAFLAWIQSGKAFIGIHAASDTYHNSPEYLDMIAGEFKTHGQQCEVEIIVEDPNHPAVKHVFPRWKIFDEIYVLKQNNREKVQVLLSLDKYPNDGSPDANKAGDHLLAWCKPYGKGKVFYTALGHRVDVWKNPVYQQHLLGGIQWALGLEK